MDLATIREQHMRRLTADVALGQRDAGSQRRAFVKSGGHEYQLKLPAVDPPDIEHPHRWTLLNELLGAVLAADVGFRVAPSALIEVPAGMLLFDNCDRLVEHGVYFGSRWLEGFCDLGEGRIRRDVPSVFAQRLYALLAFDVILFNGDRKHRDLLYPAGSDPFKADLLIVDHGNALCGSNWWASHLDVNRSTPLEPALGDWAYRYLIDEEPARSAMGQVADALAPQVSELLEAVCGAQTDAQPFVKMSEEERNAVSALLTGRIAQRDSLIEQQIDANVAYLSTHNG